MKLIPRDGVVFLSGLAVLCASCRTAVNSNLGPPSPPLTTTEFINPSFPFADNLFPESQAQKVSLLHCKTEGELNPEDRRKIEVQLGRLRRLDMPIQAVYTVWDRATVAACVVISTQMVYLVRTLDDEWHISRVVYVEQ